MVLEPTKADAGRVMVFAKTKDSFDVAAEIQETIKGHVRQAVAKQGGVLLMKRSQELQRRQRCQARQPEV